MQAVAWHGKRDVRVEEVPDPGIRKPDDVIVRITSSGVCGSDLHLYEVMTPYLNAGNVLGHEPMGVVEETGPEVTAVAKGDRVVVPFNMELGWERRHSSLAAIHDVLAGIAGAEGEPTPPLEPARR